MIEYEVLQENNTLELVAIIKANSYEEARDKALRLGYGKGYRIEEAWED